MIIPMTFPVDKVAILKMRLGQAVFALKGVVKAEQDLHLSCDRYEALIKELVEISMSEDTLAEWLRDRRKDNLGG